MGVQSTDKYIIFGFDYTCDQNGELRGCDKQFRSLNNIKSPVMTEQFDRMIDKTNFYNDLKI